MIYKAFMYFFSTIMFFTLNLFLLVGCNGDDHSFYDYYHNSQLAKKVAFEEEGFSSKQRIEILAKQAVFDKTLNLMLSREYAKNNESPKAIQALKEYISYTCNTEFIDPSFYDKEIQRLVNDSLGFWLEHAKSNHAVLSKWKDSIAQISYRDQFYRKEIDYKVNEELKRLQAVYDSTNRIVLSEITDSILEYYHYLSMERDKSKSPILLPVRFIHYDEEFSIPFLRKMIRYAEQGKCSWDLPLQMLQLVSNFYSLNNDRRTHKLRMIYLDENGIIEERSSYLQLIAIYNILYNDPRLKAELFAFDFPENHIWQTNLQWMRKFLIEKGIDKNRIAISNDLHKTEGLENEYLFGWTLIM